MSGHKRYKYVGPPDIAARTQGDPKGQVITTLQALNSWLAHLHTSQYRDTPYPATYVVDLDGHLGLADRHSEHVACAGHCDVLAAGEIFFLWGQQGWEVSEISNQSTGYCPEPSCWEAVAEALAAIPLAHPSKWTQTCTFRRCPKCEQRNFVKDLWFVCEVCGTPLPQHWNF